MKKIWDYIYSSKQGISCFVCFFAWVYFINKYFHYTTFRDVKTILFSATVFAAVYICVMIGLLAYCAIEFIAYVIEKDRVESEIKDRDKKRKAA